MAKTIDGISFNNLSKIGQGSAFNNVINGNVRSESDLQDYIDAGEEYRNIQSVLIDWNGAEVNGATINTIGDLLSKIATFEALIA